MAASRNVIREECAEASDNLIDDLIALFRNQEDMDLRNRASTSARNVSKCIHKQLEQKESSYNW